MIRWLFAFNEETAESITKDQSTIGVTKIFYQSGIYLRTVSSDFSAKLTSQFANEPS